MEGQKPAQTLREKLRVMRNVVYLLPFKSLLLTLAGLLVFLISVQSMQLLLDYTKDDASVRNAFTQRGDFDYRTSEPFLALTQQMIEDILDDALVYQDLENFASPDLLQNCIRQERARMEKKIVTATDLAVLQEKSGEYQQAFVDNGFFKSVNGRLVADKAAIRAYYEAELASLIESYKVATDDDYHRIKESLDALRGVQFAVVMHDTDALVTNTGLSSAEEIQKQIEVQPMHLLLFNSREPYYTNTSMKDIAELAQPLVKARDASFDLLISFPADLHFNDACDRIEETSLAMFETVAGRTRFILFCLIGLFLLTVALLLLAGKRESGGKIKYAVTDRLPNELHLLFHLVLLLSLLSLVGNSVYTVLHPHVDFGLTAATDYYVLRAELCTVSIYLTLTGMLCTFKRHYANRSLLSNTLVYAVIRRFRKNTGVSNEDKPA